jgi:hypothetical protein
MFRDRDRIRERDKDRWLPWRVLALVPGRYYTVPTFFRMLLWYHRRVLCSTRGYYGAGYYGYCIVPTGTAVVPTGTTGTTGTTVL